MSEDLILNFGLPGLNQIIDAAQKHRMAYGTLKKKYTNIVADELLVQGCIPDMPYEKITLGLVWIETKQNCRDPDNVRAGVKFILDAMVQTGVIPDDSNKYVKHIKDSFPIGTSRRVEVYWNICYVPERRTL